ncbi:hypothetical protein [Kutzneria buriramensis]|uniref:Lipoprotein n=1 Tax=Kutzneria buriramensis TaxID=1045776 RepID=A0A3E0HEM7_9PSEU|nr:hypothetical protein [Kutzneria buriramensis]REH43692.1 hypothetical protein BCF44_109235 [Kutzneria buriramensis]
MRTRVTAVVGAALLLAACGATPPPPGPPSLPDPTPAGAHVVFEYSGVGAKQVDLTNRVANAKTVSVHWFCLGDDLELASGETTLVGSGCARSSDGLTEYGGDIPLSLASTMAWLVKTGPDTVWRLAVTTT